MNNFRTFGAAACVLGLAACGGASTSDMPDMDQDGGLTFTTANYAMYDKLESDLEIAGARDTSVVASVTTQGTAEYQGYIEFETDPIERTPNDIAGALTLNFNFADGAGTFTGDVTDIAGRDGSQFAGQFDIAGGAVVRTSGNSPTLSANITGDMVDEDGDTVGMNARMVGQFNEATSRFARGDLTGTMTIDGTAQSIGDGDFSAERQPD